MTTSKWFAAALLLVLVYSCFPSHGERFSLRITAEVQTPEGLKAGSSVVRFRKKNKPWWHPAAVNGYFETFGEAPVVDLGSGRFLFVLLENSYDHGSIIYLADSRRLNADNTVPPAWLPTLATFDDNSDPATLRKVDPQDFAKTFGAGYRLNRMLVDKADETPTFGKVREVLRFKTDFPNRSGALRSVGWRSFLSGEPK